MVSFKIPRAKSFASSHVLSELLPRRPREGKIELVPYKPLLIENWLCSTCSAGQPAGNNVVQGYLRLGITINLAFVLKNVEFILLYGIPNLSPSLVQDEVSNRVRSSGSANDQP